MKTKKLTKQLAMTTVLVAMLGVTQVSIAGHWRRCTVWRMNGERVRVCNGGWRPGPFWPGPGWRRHNWRRRHCRVLTGRWGRLHRRCRVW